MHPYLSFNGNCRQAFEFYEACLRGKIQMIMTNGESPMAAKTPPDQLDRIMHVSLAWDGHTLAGADAPPQYYSKPQGFSIALNVKEIPEAERIFNALSEGGAVQMPLQATFWAQRFGMFVDRFGIPWMINSGQPAS
jgi:PhnB protein